MSRSRARLAALALTVLVASVIAAVVLSDRDTGEELPPTRQRPAAAAEGSLKVGVPELPSTYNPFDIRSRNAAATQVLSMVLPQLFEVRPDGEVVGRLVDEGSIEEAGRRVTFRLVDEARWSDGTPITVADIAFTHAVVGSEAWPGPDAGYDLLTEVTGRGRSVTFTFSSAFPGWQRLFSGNDYVLPKHRLDGKDLVAEWSTGPDLAGGPYLFKGSTPGLNVILSANEQWWGGGPGVRDLEVLTVPDATTLQTLFERGELDVIWMPAFTERVREMEEIPDTDLNIAPPGGRIASLYVQVDEIGESLRLASLDLVDRDRLVNVLLDEEASIAQSWGRLEDGPGWPQWFIDPSKAEDLDSTQMAFALPDEDPMASLLARALQHRARSTPLSFDAVPLTNHLLAGEWLPQGTFDVAFVSEVQWPDPCWRCRFASEYIGETNWSRVDDIDDLAERADRGDTAAASALEKRLQEAGVVLPLWRPSTVVVSRGVAGIEANAWSSGPFWRVEQWETSTDRSVQSTTSSAASG